MALLYSRVIKLFDLGDGLVESIHCLLQLHKRLDLVWVFESLCAQVFDLFLIFRAHL